MTDSNKEPVTVNKKIRNATPLTVDGIKFRSKLEAYTYSLLKQNNIFNNYEQFSFTLIDQFEWGDEKIRSITYKPDFVGTGWVIECKGFKNDSFPLRWKLFKNYLKRNNLSPRLYLVKNQKEVNDAILDILKTTNHDNKELL